MSNNVQDKSKKMSNCILWNEIIELFWIELNDHRTQYSIANFQSHFYYAKGEMHSMHQTCKKIEFENLSSNCVEYVNRSLQYGSM